MRPTARHLVAAFAVAALVLPAAGAAASTQELEELREQLDGAERDLADLDAQLEHAEARIADATSRLDRASAHLAGVEADLEAAREAHEAALIEERETAARAADANAQLDAQLDDHHDARDQLNARAVQLYKHGPVQPEAALLRGVTASTDLHQVAVTVETVSRVVEHERGMVTLTAELTRDIVSARAEVVEARQAAEAAARLTSTEEQRVADLVADQQLAVEGLADEQRQHAQVLTDLENDAELQEALVERLRHQIRELEFDASQVLFPAELQLDLDRPAPEWRNQLPAGGRSWATMIDAVGAKHGIDGRLLAAVVWTESNFGPTAVSHAGAIGLAQLMPGTASGLGVDPWDPIQNLDGGARYLRTQLERFGSLDLALAAYNAGPGRVASAGPGIPNIVETQLYVVRVLERYQELSGA